MTYRKYGRRTGNKFLKIKNVSKPSGEARMGGVRSRTKAAPERHQSRTSQTHQGHGRTATRQTVREGTTRDRSGTAATPQRDRIKTASGRHRCGESDAVLMRCWAMNRPQDDFAVLLARK